MSTDPAKKADPKAAKKDDKAAEPEPLPDIEIPEETWTYDQRIAKK